MGYTSNTVIFYDGFILKCNKRMFSPVLLITSLVVFSPHCTNCFLLLISKANLCWRSEHNKWSKEIKQMYWLNKKQRFSRNINQNETKLYIVCLWSSKLLSSLPKWATHLPSLNLFVGLVCLFDDIKQTGCTLGDLISRFLSLPLCMLFAYCSVFCA